MPRETTGSPTAWAMKLNTLPRAKRLAITSNVAPICLCTCLLRTIRRTPQGARQRPSQHASDKREKQSRRNRLLQPVGSGGVYGCNVRDLSYSQDEKKALALPWRGYPVRGAPDAGGPARFGSRAPPHATAARSICHLDPFGESGLLENILFLVCVFLSSTIYTIIALVL